MTDQPIFPYDVFAEIFSHLSVVDRPLTTESRRPSSYWAPRARSYGDSNAYPHLDRLKQAEARYESPLSANEEASIRLRRSTLASAALVCKTFADIALAELWAAPPGGLYSILGVLPAFKSRAVHVPNDSGDGSTFYHFVSLDMLFLLRHLTLLAVRIATRL